MKCQCPSCTDTQAKTYTEQHRAECEARDVMRMPKERRDKYYSGVKKNRGEAAVLKLIEEVKRQWKDKNK